MLSSKNPWDRVFALFKIFKILSQYKENDQRKMDIWDKHLIKGIYSRSQHSYQHLEKDYFSEGEDTVQSSDSGDEGEGL